MAPVTRYWEALVTLPPEGTPAPAHQSEQVWISTFLLAEVTGLDNQPAGQVAGLLLDPQANLRYLILQDGERFIPVPWMYVDRDPEMSALFYTDDPQRLIDAPSSSSLEEAHTIDVTQEADLRTFWGMK